MVKAVITGDIMQSTKMSQEHKTGLIREIKTMLKQVIDKEYNTKSEFYRGDSFQCLVNDPADALRVALIIKTFIRSLNPTELADVTKRSKPESKTGMIYPVWLFDARMAIGIGEVEMETKQVATSNGVAFELSGRLLDQLKDTRNRLGIATDDEYQDELHVAAILLDAIISKTSTLQCEVIDMKLLGYTEVQIAKDLGIMQSAVNQRSISGNWNAVNAMVERFETIYGHD